MVSALRVYDAADKPLSEYGDGVLLDVLKDVGYIVDYIDIDANRVVIERWRDGIKARYLSESSSFTVKQLCARLKFEQWPRYMDERTIGSLSLSVLTHLLRSDGWAVDRCTFGRQSGDIVIDAAPVTDASVGFKCNTPLAAVYEFFERTRWPRLGDTVVAESASASCDKHVAPEEKSAPPPPESASVPDPSANAACLVNDTRADIDRQERERRHAEKLAEARAVLGAELPTPRYPRATGTSDWLPIVGPAGIGKRGR